MRQRCCLTWAVPVKYTSTHTHSLTHTLSHTHTPAYSHSLTHSHLLAPFIIVVSCCTSCCAAISLALTLRRRQANRRILAECTHTHGHTNHASCFNEPNESRRRRRQDALPCSVAALAFPLFHSFSFQTLGKRVGPAASCRLSFVIRIRYVTSYVTLRAYAVFAQCSSNFIQQYANIDGQYQ